MSTHAHPSLTGRTCSMPRRPASRIRNGAFVFVAATNLSCADPPPLPVVTVTIRDIAIASVASPMGSSITITVCLASGIDAGASQRTDAGGMCAGSEVQRAIFWDRTDPFDFDIQVPTATYGSVRAEATTAVLCPSGPQQIRVARGAAGRVLVTSASTPAHVEITMIADPGTCL